MILATVARCLVGLALMSGCAANHYRTAFVSQQTCCQHLPDGPARAACLAELPRTQDPMSSINQETFECVARGFQCDPTTGRATRASAQQQLDCLNGLESTQRLATAK